MISGWMIFFGLVWAYIALLWWLIRTGRMEKWNLSLMLGFVLMIRTGRGRDTLERLAKPRRMWNVFADLGIVITLLGMVAMTLVMVLLLGPTLSPDSGVEALGAKEILVIPGVNPFVPLWYGIAALIITLVVHEGGHGILARANDLKVKSLGLLFAIVPIGAFVEPDEEELNVTSRRKRMRVFAAGPTVNIVVAGLCLAAFAGMVAAAEPHDGVAIRAVTADAPAEMAGIRPGDILVSFNGTTLLDFDQFQSYMDEQAPGDNITVGLRDGRSLTITVGSVWADYLDDSSRERIVEENATLAEELQNDAFLGVRLYQSDVEQDRLAQPFGVTAGANGRGVPNALVLVSLPFYEIRDDPYLGAYLPSFYEAPGNDQAYWIGATLFFWVFWINLMVGLTNILPMLPLDGGHMFRDAVASIVERTRPGMEQERQDRIVGRAATFVSLFVLGVVILTFIGPRLAQAFA